MQVDLVVIGGGPGGYSTAFRAADLGLKVALIEREAKLGGTCLHVGCIPSKTLLHALGLRSEMKHYRGRGLSGDSPEIDLDELRNWKQEVINKLAKGIENLARQRKVSVIRGEGRFVGPGVVVVETADEKLRVDYNYAVIATGSRPIDIPDLSDISGVIDSSGALAIESIPEHLLIIGAGIIGLEMAQIYHELGSQITLVDMQPVLLPDIDREIVRPLERRLKRICHKINLASRVDSVVRCDDKLEVAVSGEKGEQTLLVDRVLVAIGRVANSEGVGLETIGIEVMQNGCIATDETGKTDVESVYAIGDVTGQPMLAHRAVHQGCQVAEVIAGKRDKIDLGPIPSVLYTDPEIAWVGESEASLKAKSKECRSGNFPWAANGRSLSMGRNDGITRLTAEKDGERLLGGQIVGPHAGDLIGEVALALRLNAGFESVAETIHPHPTLSETVGMAAEVLAGTATDILNR